MPRKIKRVLLCIRRGGSFLRDKLIEIMEKHGVSYDKLEDLSSGVDFSGYDAVVVVGSDRDVLETLQYMGEKPEPILHISPPGYTAFFSAIEWNSIETEIPRFINGFYKLEEATRLKAVIDGKEVVYGLNELALFSSRSAVLINYVLEVDGETIWRDTSDGVIIATPIGSTAYAYSAGGPIVMKNARVFVVVPVNSLNPVRKPLVVSDSSTIALRDISSSYRCEAIVDGVIRIRTRREIILSKAEHPAVFIKPARKLGETIEKKTRLALEEEDMPPSAKFVYKMLEIYGEASIKDLVKITGLPERTVRYALSILVRKGLVKKIVNLRDTRQRIYRIAK
ncbi:MAG: N-acetylmuramoyl-L-alanine amidase [Thermoprotei archaeon]